MYLQEFDKERSAAEANSLIDSAAESDTNVITDDEEGLTGDILSEEELQQFDDESHNLGWGDHPILRPLMLLGLVGTMGLVTMLIANSGGPSKQPIVEEPQSEKLLAEMKRLQRQNASLQAKLALVDQIEAPDAESGLRGEDSELEAKSKDSSASESLPPSSPAAALPPPPPMRQQQASIQRLPVPIQPNWGSPTVVAPVPAPPRFSHSQPRPLPPAVSASPVTTPPPAPSEISPPPPSEAPSLPSPSLTPPTEPSTVAYVIIGVQPHQTDEIENSDIDTESLVQMPALSASSAESSELIKTVFSGTQADIQLDQTIVWSNGQPSTSTIIARLEEPLHHSDGSLWLDEGNKLVLKNRGLTRDGVALLDVVAYQDQEHEQSLPEDALVVATEDGGPVIAQKQSGSSGLANAVGDVIVDVALEEAQNLIKDSAGSLGSEIFNAALDRTKANRNSQPTVQEQYVLDKDSNLTVEVTRPIEIVVESPDIVEAVAPNVVAEPHHEIEHPTEVAVIAPPPMVATPITAPPPGEQQALPTLEQLQAGVLNRDRGTYSNRNGALNQ